MSRMPAWKAAIEVLRETNNPRIMWGDLLLLHAVADKLGWEQEGYKTACRVMAALSRTPGSLIKKKLLAGRRQQRPVNAFYVR
jgi:hypothetical protein